MNKKNLIVVGIVAILVLIVINLIVFSPSKEAIEIGIIAPLTGGPALWGQGSVNMIQMATEEINANGGINGRDVQLIIEDGKCSPQDAVNAVNKLIQVDQVKFILGGHCSPETTAIVPIINEKKVFLLAGVTSTDDAVSSSKYAFRTSPPTLDQAKKVADVAYDKYGYKKIALITEEAAYSKSFTTDLKKTFKGTIAEELNYVPGEKDFRTGLAKIKAESPDAIWISPQDPNEAVLILNQMKELDMMDIPLFGNTVFISSDVYDKSGGLLPSNAFTITLFADPTSQKSILVQEKYQDKFGTTIPYNLYYVSAAYDATYMLKDALEDCGEDVDCVTEYFNNLADYDGVSGKFTFKENGDPAFDSWKEMKIVGGKAVLE
ncbi:MAG: ABC transporter substrate-binding protein [Nanoarchaeota archaeon]|nr:ABC transporter substrate-binding protein [Nanoarchaeota archaeon]